MIYDTFANIARGAAHSLIDITFPRTATIATITGVASYLAHNKASLWGGPYIYEKIRPYITIPGISTEKIPIPEVLRNYFEPTLVSIGDRAKDFIETSFAEALAVKVAPYFPLAASIAAGCVASTAMNIIHIGVLKVIACWKWVFAKETEPQNAPPPPLNVIPGERKDAPAAPKRLIEIPIYTPPSVHDMYFQAGKV